MCIRDSGVHNAKVEGFEVTTPDATSGTTQGILVDAGSGDTVSYTHLTLPTSDLV